MSSAGKWDHWYANLENVQPYVDTLTYQLGAEFLSSCQLIEDWGCGAGWMRKFIPADKYIGVDGSRSRFADRVVDLETYTSDVDGIFMRHVLEHNYAWEPILRNAVASFRRRFVLVTFTPHGDTTHEIGFEEDPGVPNISLAKQDITRHFSGLSWSEETYATDTQYGTETIFFVERVSTPSGRGRWLLRRLARAVDRGRALRDLTADRTRRRTTRRHRTAARERLREALGRVVKRPRHRPAVATDDGEVVQLIGDPERRSRDREPSDSSPDAQPWVRVEHIEGEPEPLADWRFFAVLGTWNEADVVEACVRNAMTQGCEKVFLVDNNSDDDTVERAVHAGAILARRYATDGYDEPLRLRLMNEVVEWASRDCGAPHVWWLFMDGDEFAHGRGGLTLREQIAGLDRRYRVLGTRYLNHYPSEAPQPGRVAHPLDYQPLAEELIFHCCELGHRKHPIQRWDAAGPRITCGRGFHEARCPVQLVEPPEAAILHHFPFRDEAATRARMAKLCESRDGGGRPRAPMDDTASHMWPRYHSMDAVYRQDWDEVIDFMSGGASGSPKKGVDLRPWTEILENADTRVARWY